MIYIAEVVSGDDWTVPLCLACALAQPPASQCPLKIRVQSNIAELEAVAQSFERLLRQPVPEGCAGDCPAYTCLYSNHATAATQLAVLAALVWDKSVCG